MKDLKEKLIERNEMKVVFVIYCQKSWYDREMSPMLSWEEDYIAASEQVEEYQKRDIDEKGVTDIYSIYAACVPDDFSGSEADIIDKKWIEFSE